MILAKTITFKVKVYFPSTAFINSLWKRHRRRHRFLTRRGITILVIAAMNSQRSAHARVGEGNFLLSNNLIITLRPRAWELGRRHISVC